MAQKSLTKGYNKSMKKSLKICLSIIFMSFMLVSPLAVAFLFQNAKNIETSNTTEVSLIPQTENSFEKKQTWETPTYKTYEDYFADYNIATDGDFAKTTITGKGTKASPYKINSTEDFIFLTKISLSAKYIDLESDIVLNDEVFSEEGVPSGGDGVVYSWKPIATWANCYFNGNEHTISQYYINDNTKNNVGLFYCSSPQMKNLKVKDMFLCGSTYVCGVNTSSNQTNQFYNIHNLGGTILGEHKVSGICQEGKRLENSSNNANIKQTTNTTKGTIAGLSCGNYISYYNNCVNYGNVEAKLGSYITGIGARVGNSMTNCKNFGSISATGNFTGLGGLAGQVAGGKIVDCVNYGSIQGREVDGGSAAGICGYLYKFSEFYTCINYGKVKKASGIVGAGYGANLYDCINYGDIEYGCGLASQFYSLDYCLFSRCINYGNIKTDEYIFGFFLGTLYGGNYEFVDCENYGNVTGRVYGYSGLFGVFVSDKKIMVNLTNIVHHTTYTNMAYLLTYCLSKGHKVNISNMKINIEAPSVCFLYYTTSGSELNVKNMEIIANTKEKANSFTLAEANNVSLKNVYIENNCNKTKEDVVLIGKFKATTIIDGLVNKVKFTNGEENFYYASKEDFSNFYVDYKTGKIGLKALSGKGFYQGKVTEEWLIGKGFEKKTA